ncbi:MAG TPA: sialate O-acetylesterase [Rhizomicrobium sp.]|nr:sialate O-acetylesterase [Rhizomicrobium sp.]
MHVRRIFIGLLLAALASPALAQAPLFSPIFADHAVIQRDRPIPVWGTADSDAEVTVAFAGNSVSTHADADGQWRAKLPAVAAGGPYTLEAKSNGRAQQVNDVLVGDVWLCSGQSNMQLSVSHTLDADTEIASTDNASIRMATIPDAIGGTPLSALAQPAVWQPATPQTVGNFSAACFYFARELQKTVDVPMGLVNASWGGAKIRTWMSKDALRATGYFGPLLAIGDIYAKDPQSAVAPFGAMWEAWWRKTVPGEVPWNPSLDVSAWPVAPALGEWDDWGIPSLVDHTGLVWYRTQVKLSAAQAARPASLAIGQVDEIGAAWVNGVFVGDGSAGDQTYKIPPGTLHAGENIIAVNILNTYKKGGLVGPASAQGIAFADGTVPLSEPWRYNIVPQSVGEPPRAPWEPLGGMGMAYNGMIAPIEPYGLRGALWYQGESDTGEPEKYKTQLLAMMNDWRQKFDAPLPFLIVQLPNYGIPATKPEPSGWADLREAQRQAAAADKDAALVTTIDIGEDYDIHPPNKQEVGRRLALAARRLVYGENIVATGPIAQSVTREKGRLAVRFADIEKGLAVYGGDAPVGFQLCMGATCRYAAASVSSGKVYLHVPAKFAPTHVRYCWADSPICTLFDGVGLPAAPFDLPVTGVKAKTKTAKKKTGRGQ